MPSHELVSFYVFCSWGHKQVLDPLTSFSYTGVLPSEVGVLCDLNPCPMERRARNEEKERLMVIVSKLEGFARAPPLLLWPKPS
jgi:hypothetical protein